MTILVTGARGNVGRSVLGGLIAAGETVRASGRDAKTLEVPAGVEKVSIDIENPDSIGSALDGVEGVFLYARPQGIDGFAKTARQAGVRHIVMLSSSAVIEPHADANPIAIMHRAAERALEESGVGYTILHPWYFATNALAWAEDIRAESTVYTPYPDARIGAIHEGDIGNVAATVLSKGTHQGESLSLTGPQQISFAEQVEVLSAVLDRPIAVHELTPDEARKRTPLPAPIFDAILRAWSGAVEVPVPVTDTVEVVTGTAPRTFHQWVVDHRAAWGGGK